MNAARVEGADATARGHTDPAFESVSAILEQSAARGGETARRLVSS
jgi:hypothetical protein